MRTLYCVGLLFLVVYSYSQIDLNLTLIQNPLFLNFQSSLIWLGYYNRFLSALIFLGIVLILFLGYFQILKSVEKGKFTVSNLRAVIVVIIVAGLLSYMAFSYDFFNYLFDARIVTKYGQNPYLFKPLDFTGDTWLRFMHWTHRTYPYGPIWLLLTIPLSLIGSGKFLVTVLNFKIFFLITYLSSGFLIKKISEKIKPGSGLYASAFFLLNPLVIIESVISPHLDSVMGMFLLLSFWFLVSGKRLYYFISMFFSAGIKFLTIILLPLPLLGSLKLKTKIKLAIIGISIALIPVIIQRELYPWYILPILALVSLDVDDSIVKYLALSFSIGLVLSYLPFLLVGSYPPDVQLWKTVLIFLPLVVFLPLTIKSLGKIKKIT